MSFDPPLPSCIRLAFASLFTTSRQITNVLLSRLPCLLLYSSNNQIPRYNNQTNFNNQNSNSKQFEILNLVIVSCLCPCFLVIGISVVKQQAFDLHALDTPPAFILSQDQTLIKFFTRFTCLVIHSLLKSKLYIKIFEEIKFLHFELAPVSTKICPVRYCTGYICTS